MGWGRMKISCSICARGGSKGVANKNLRKINGIPLIAHTIRQARASSLFDFIAVSSDSEEILRAAKEEGVDIIVKRPEEMAQDTSPKIPVIQHCFKQIETETQQTFDYHFDLDATSPLRAVSDIEGCLNLILNEDATNIITGCQSRRSPYFNLVERDDKGNVGLSKNLPSEVTRRQDSPQTFDMNASIYVWSRESLLRAKSVFMEKTKIYEMPESRSIDIDNPLDFKIVEFIMENSLNT